VNLLDEAEMLAYGDNIRTSRVTGTADVRAQAAWDTVKSASREDLPHLTAVAWALEAKCSKTPRAAELCRKAAAAWRSRA
jgi:hypothetical protein